MTESQKPRETRNSLAAIAGVSHGTLDKAKKIIESADEQTKERLRRGEMSIHRAYIELKQNDQKSDPATEDVPDSEKFPPKNASPVSLLKKPVFEHYEPPTYMAPIPFEPVVPATVEATAAETNDAVYPEAKAVTDAVQDLIRTFLRDLDELLDALDHRGMAQALEMIQKAERTAIQTVQNHLNKFQEEPS